MKEGRFRPSFHPAGVDRPATAGASMKEGRFRPSFLQVRNGTAGSYKPQ